MKMEPVDQYLSPLSMMSWHGEGSSATNRGKHVGMVCDDVVALFCKLPSLERRGAVSPIDGYRIKPRQPSTQARHSILRIM
jgi:hypothetical protein